MTDAAMRQKESREQAIERLRTEIAASGGVPGVDVSVGPMGGEGREQEIAVIWKMVFEGKQYGRGASMHIDDVWTSETVMDWARTSSAETIKTLTRP